MKQQNPPATTPLEARARSLGLYGLVARWQELAKESWIERIIVYEEAERGRRSLERRIMSAKLGAFKPISDFDWGWPRKVDRELIDELLNLQFIRDATNVILIGPNGVGKTMIAKNLAYQAVLQGYTARFLTASELLNDLAAQESGSALTRRLRHYMHPQLLVIDEVAYLAAGTRHADLLFELVSRRYQQKAIVLTTTKPFQEWNEVFPSTGCLVSLIDRLIHKSELVNIDADSYRRKEAEERAAARAGERSRKRGKAASAPAGKERR